MPGAESGVVVVLLLLPAGVRVSICVDCGLSTNDVVFAPCVCVCCGGGGGIWYCC